MVEQARCLDSLALLLHGDGKLDDAKEVAFRAIDLFRENGKEYQVCKCHHLGIIYRSKGETKKAIHHFEVALEVAAPSNWLNLLFWIQFNMAELSSGEGRFDDAHAHVGEAKLHATSDNDTYLLARAMRLRARF